MENGIALIDAHAHLRKIQEYKGFSEIIQKAGFEAINLACIAIQRDSKTSQTANLTALLFKALNPDQVYVFSGLEYGLENVRKPLVPFEAQARKWRSIGADGFKMIEGKPTVRERLGISLSDPLYDGFYAYLEEAHIPLLCHVADPLRMGKAAYRDDDHVSNEQLYSELDDVLNKHPGLPVVLAHFYFLSADIDRANSFLCNRPNVCFDLTPGWEMYGNFSKKPDEWASFFKKHQDRIIFGTDNTAHSAKAVQHSLNRPAFVKRCLSRKNNLNLHEIDMNWLEESRGIQVRNGLGLATPELQKICSGNFKRITGEEPLRVDKEAMMKECRVRIDQMAGNSECEAVLADLKDILARSESLV